MKAAIISAGVVQSVVEASEQLAAAQGWIVCDDSVHRDMLYAGGAFTEPPAAPLDRAGLSAQIDAAVIAIYDKPMLLSKEYEAREAAAQAYKSASYTGTVPARVAGFATPAGLSAQVATDLILSQAAQLRGALDSLSDLRMAKYVITRKDSVTGAYVATDAQAQASADSTLSQIAAIAAQLG